MRSRVRKRENLWGVSPTKSWLALRRELWSAYNLLGLFQVIYKARSYINSQIFRVLPYLSLNVGFPARVSSWMWQLHAVEQTTKALTIGGCISNSTCFFFNHYCYFGSPKKLYREYHLCASLRNLRIVLILVLYP